MSNEELVEQIKNGINTTDSLEKLYVNNRPYIFKIANKYTGYAEIDDLMQEAYFGLYEAVQHFEDNHEVLFMTYAAYWIRQAIQRYIDNFGNGVRFPVHFHSRMYKYNKTISAYQSKLNRKPTDNELCSALNISFKVLKELRQAIQEVSDIDSLDRTMTSEDDNYLLVDSVQDDVNIENDVIDRVIKDKIHTELWEIVQNNTTLQENEVIVGRFKRNMTLDALGREQRVTRERIRCIEAKALRKLRYPRVCREIENRFEINYARAYRGSVSSFNNTWSSSTELAALDNLNIQYQGNFIV